MRKNFDIPSIRARLAGQSGQKYWRSLEEIAETEEFQDFIKHEFPQGVDQWLNPVGRRNFLKLMAASLALGGLSGCSITRTPEKIVPYVEAPERIVQSVPQFYATTFQTGGVGIGVLAESHMARPTKIEGNPDHPASLGKTDAFVQASILQLYDPDRAKTMINGGRVSSYTNFLNDLALQVEIQRATNGAGFRILTETITSPSLINQIEAILEEFPEAKWYQYEPVNRDNAREGAMMAFGEDVNTVYNFDRAEVVVSLDANFMNDGAAAVRYAHDFSEKRRVREDKTEMNRLYMVECTPSATGTLADHRLGLSSAEIEAFARALAVELGLDIEPPVEESLSHVPEDWIPAIARDLQENSGQSIVIAGDYQAPVVHAIAHAINDALGNVGQTVTHTEPLAPSEQGHFEGLQALVEEMAAETVNFLLIVEANPVYNAPADLNFVENLQKVAFRVRDGLYEDETSAWCHWSFGSRHYLEAWGDVRAYDGSVSLVQPLVEPFYDVRSSHQLMAAILGDSELTGYEVVQQYWSEGKSEEEFKEFWHQALFNGVIADTALPEKSVSVNLAEVNAASPAEVDEEAIEITFRPDPAIWDGRWSNNGWMQELPKPISKLTWDNAALMSPALAERIGVTNGDMVTLTYEGRSLQAPVWVMPGQARNTVTVHLGYGRERVGRVGDGVGFNAYSLRTSDAPWSGTGLNIEPTIDNYQLASTQTHYGMEGRHLVQKGTIEEYRENPKFATKYIEEKPYDVTLSLMPGYEYESYAWGMVVDLNTCHGCNACVVACQAENNIPVVGKEEVLIGREMHWMRIDSYFDGELDDPHMHHQPVMCQHCEQAPCELVCPVNATVHDHEGLNVMVYNRCIGTRYCANNCPYKVRRFNFLQYNDLESDEESLKAQKNPDVTVRTRGVMEKCTYCIQRISRARIDAKNENRRIQDGEVVSACQAACPTNAIIFGDLNDPDSAVAQAQAQPTNYGLLTELGTRPRTTYLAKLRNPNPEIAETHSAGGHG